MTASNANTGTQSIHSDVPVVRRRTNVVKREKELDNTSRSYKNASVETAVDIEPTEALQFTTSASLNGQ